MVPLLQNIMCQEHSRVPKCDGRLHIQVDSEPFKRMVTTPSGVQADLSLLFTPHIDLFATHLNHKLPLIISPVSDQQACKVYALNINLPGLIAYPYPLMALFHMVIKKFHQCNCIIILIAPGWPGMP